MERWEGEHCGRAVVPRRGANEHALHGFPAAGNQASRERAFPWPQRRSARPAFAGAGLRSVGARRRKGSKVHAAVDPLGHLLTVLVTPADEQDRAQVGRQAAAVQEVTGAHVEVAFVDQGYTGDAPAQAAQAQGIRLQVVTWPEAKRGFVLLPRRWVVERSFAWTTRFRRLARD